MQSAPLLAGTIVIHDSGKALYLCSIPQLMSQLTLCQMGAFHKAPRVAGQELVCTGDAVQACSFAINLIGADIA